MGDELVDLGELDALVALEQGGGGFGGGLRGQLEDGQADLGDLLDDLAADGLGQGGFLGRGQAALGFHDDALGEGRGDGKGEGDGEG